MKDTTFDIHVHADTMTFHKMVHEQLGFWPNVNSKTTQNLIWHAV